MNASEPAENRKVSASSTLANGAPITCTAPRPTRAADFGRRLAQGQLAVAFDQVSALHQAGQVSPVGRAEEYPQQPGQDGNPVQQFDAQHAQHGCQRNQRRQYSQAQIGGNHQRAAAQTVDPYPGCHPEEQHRQAA